MTKLEKDGLKLAKLIVDRSDYLLHMLGESACPDDEIEKLAKQIVKENQQIKGKK